MDKGVKILNKQPTILEELRKYKGDATIRRIRAETRTRANLPESGSGSDVNATTGKMTMNNVMIFTEQEGERDKNLTRTAPTCRASGTRPAQGPFSPFEGDEGEELRHQEGVAATKAELEASI